MNYTYEYPRPAMACDVVLFYKSSVDIELLLIERKNEPCKGLWAFPGGFMDMDETCEQAALRELKEETGVELRTVHFGVLADAPGRDPRGRVITAMYYAIVEEKPLVQAADDATDCKWFSLDHLPSLAFDHAIQLKKIKEIAFL